jgi:pSer/pThr/pTyr-binding forkhead associated (FHA) protein
MVLGQGTKTPELSATLICTSGPHTGDVVRLKSGITTIGRSSDNIITLSKDKEISRHHALIIQESGRFVVQDQNSLNGTFVNDEQVTSPRYLEDGDVILVGVSTFRYEEE